MIVHVYNDGSEGYEYEVGDRVIVERTLHGGWFDYGPTHAETCTVVKISFFKTTAYHLADLDIRYSSEWGPARCTPRMVKPHPETMAKATRQPRRARIARRA